MNKKISNSLEDYLEKIWELVDSKGVTHAVDIANSLNVKKPSVTSALKKLSSKGLIIYQPYQPIELTVKGKELAKQITKKHITIKNFFIRVLGINPKKSDEMACVMEHLVDEEVAGKFSAFQEFIERCPDIQYKWFDEKGFFCSNKEGEKCNKCENNIKNAESATEENIMTSSLTELLPGESGIVNMISNDSKIRRKLAEMGVSKGRPIQLVRVAPLGDPVEIKVRGYQLSLRKEEAENIKVVKM